MNKELLNKIDEIISLIENSKEYQKYLLLKDEMNNNSDIKKLINEIRVLQKDVVHHLDKKEKLRKRMDELNAHPLYREYNNTLASINNVYAIIESNLNNYFQRIVN